jgi:hypothetical protein
VDWCNFAREVCATILEVDSSPIGGPGKIVEIDESKFGKRKYHRGRRVDGLWVFGGIESGTRKCLLICVQDRVLLLYFPSSSSISIMGQRFCQIAGKAVSPK